MRAELRRVMSDIGPRCVLIRDGKEIYNLPAIETSLKFIEMAEEFIRQYLKAGIGIRTVKVIITPEHAKNIIASIPAYILNKEKEEIYDIDNNNLFFRLMSGLLGEVAIEILFGIPILQRDKNGMLKIGPSGNFAGADFSQVGLDLGVKTCSYTNFPAVKRLVKRPQVICIRMKDDSIRIGGYASKDLQLNHLSSDYIKDWNLRNRRDDDLGPHKMAFTGLEFMPTFTTFDELKALYHSLG